MRRPLSSTFGALFPLGIELAPSLTRRRDLQLSLVPRRPSGRAEEHKLVMKIHELSERYPRFGYRKIFDRLKTSGWRVGREQVRLLRRREGLRVPQKAVKRRRPGNQHD